MSKMRLTTLNLDQECLDILGSKKNKSAAAREAIKGYEEADDEASFFEERYIISLRKLSHVVTALVKAAEDTSQVHLFYDFLTDYLDETTLEVAKMVRDGVLEHELRRAIDRHVMP